MCHVDVQMPTHSCGHPEAISEEKVDCGRKNCSYSAQHPAGCKPCSCNKTMGPRKSITSGNVDKPCYRCNKQAR
ncbi:hypothetical protein JAAARDRAFT_38697 [Jaapia argillacea MUCL 33604]|uniref:Uncharacterized protein n=1 Tax=Jaapia argillacea MUCL 33604 TaxID=933084 RepID=A0A067PJR7_9AGAM|nr:hypothetical protein JAAARDRAFT_38697 [Jaapia argillacea MUCL 33604]